MHDPVMAVGGLAVPESNLKPINEALKRLNEEYNVYYEVKWSTTRDRRQCGQTAYANYLKKLIAARQAHFHIRFAPFAEYDHKASGPKRRAATTGKMHYQLLLHRALRFYGDMGVHIRPDNGECTSELRRFRGALSGDAHRKYGVRRDSILSLECRDSVKEPLLQLLDVTLGALTAHRNNRHLSKSGGIAKRRLAVHIHSLHGRPNLAWNSPSGTRAFCIWNAVPAWGGRGPRG